MYRQAVEADPTDAYRNVRLGALLLEMQDAEGVQYVRDASSCSFRGAA